MKIERNIKKAMLSYNEWLNTDGKWGVFPNKVIKGDDLKGQLKNYICTDVIKKDGLYAITKNFAGKILVKRIGMSDKTKRNYEKGWSKYGSSSILREVM